MKSLWMMVVGAGVVLCAAAQGAEASREWKQVQSRHFVVFYKNTPVDFAHAVLESAEQYYDQIKRDLGFVRYSGWDFERRARIYIYDNQQDYVASASYFEWSAGVAYTDSRMVKTYPSAAGFFDSLLPHEIGHIMFREFIGDQHTTVPRWFDEGIAMYQERARRWGAHEIVKKAIADGSFIPLDQLSRTRLNQNSPRELVDLFYVQAASAVYFLIQEYGEFRFLNLCRKMKSGSTFERAFESAYPHLRTVSRFNDAWVAFLKK